MRIGILGGTFDPPHSGHLILASEALEQLNLDQVLWVLTPDPPHKQDQVITTLPDRLTMVELAIEGNPRFILSRVDIDRPPPHFAVDTMVILRQQSPEDEFYYLMGLDSLDDLPDWHMPVEFVQQCHYIAVMLRAGEHVDVPELEADIPGLSNRLIFLRTPIIEISGAEIRRRAYKGRPYRYFLPDKVYQYIQEKHLYQA